jgi:hypothetical protein
MKLVKSRCVEIAERIMREIWLSVRESGENWDIATR